MAKQYNNTGIVRFDVLAPVTISWDVTTYSPVEVLRRFGVTFCLHLQVLMVNRLLFNGFLLGLHLCSKDGGNTLL
jgi:hypothetical protein